MNVNNPIKKKRRTADEARELILQTAADRLREFGLDGLTVKGVAEAAGMSHATLIHHFGSSEQMRQELEVFMNARLLADVITSLQQENVSPEALCRDLFATLSRDGHARLLAWRAVEGSTDSPQPSPDIQALFKTIIDSVATQMADGDPATARNVVMLVASTAIGLSISGSVLPHLLGMSDTEEANFPQWLADTVTHSHC